jgi:hypothetical protein
MILLCISYTTICNVHRERQTDRERERERERERDVFLCGTGVNLCELPVSFTKRKFLHGHPEMQKQRNAR